MRRGSVGGNRDQKKPLLYDGILRAERLKGSLRARREECVSGRKQFQQSLDGPAKLFKSGPHVNFDETIRTARESLLRALEQLALKTFHVDEENVRRTVFLGKIIDRIGVDFHLPPVAAAIVDLAIGAAVENHGSASGSSRGMQDLQVLDRIQLPVLFSGLAVFGAGFHREHGALRADGLCEHQGHYALVRSDVEHACAGPQTDTPRSSATSANSGQS